MLTPGEAAARAETARIYSGLTPEHHGSAQRLHRIATYPERARLTVALRDAIELSLADTASIRAAMDATGASYDLVRGVWREMAE